MITANDFGSPRLPVHLKQGFDRLKETVIPILEKVLECPDAVYLVTVKKGVDDAFLFHCGHIEYPLPEFFTALRLILSLIEI